MLGWANCDVFLFHKRESLLVCLHQRLQGPVCEASHSQDEQTGNVLSILEVDRCIIPPVASLSVASQAT